MKMWVGSLDGSREGLVIAPTKVRTGRAYVRRIVSDEDRARLAELEDDAMNTVEVK